MTNVPHLGQKVRVWPMPGRRVQFDERPVDFMGGGRVLQKNGETVEWTSFRMEQLKQGDLLLHHPPCDEHDHGDRGDEECMHCGRTVAHAEQYDVQRAEGIAAAEAAVKEGLPLHPYEQQETDRLERVKLRDERKAKKAQSMADKLVAKAQATAAPSAAAAARAVAGALNAAPPAPASIADASKK